MKCIPCFVTTQGSHSCSCSVPVVYYSLWVVRFGQRYCWGFGGCCEWRCELVNVSRHLKDQSVFISSSGGIQHWFIRNVRKATQRHILKTWTPFRVFPSTFKFLLSVLFHPDSLAAVCCCCMSVTQGASVVSSTFILKQTEHRTITDRAATMPAECCTAGWRIFSTAVCSCHLLPSFVTNKRWWLTNKRMLWSMDDEPTTRG